MVHIIFQFLLSQCGGKDFKKASAYSNFGDLVLITSEIIYSNLSKTAEIYFS